MAHNRQPTDDLRVRRTRKLLMQALIELTVEKGFSAITVQDIADRAMIHRATFYRHYLDKYDLLEHYMNDVYELTASQEPLSSGHVNGHSAGSPPVGMVRMLEHVQEHADFYRAMLGMKGDLAFAHKIQQFIERRLRIVLSDEEDQLNSNGLPLDLCLNYLSHAGVGVLAWWLKNGQSYAPEQVAVLLNRLTQGTLEQVLGSPSAPKP